MAITVNFRGGEMGRLGEGFYACLDAGRTDLDFDVYRL